jgi:hypothetical protein
MAPVAALVATVKIMKELTNSDIAQLIEPRSGWASGRNPD